MKVESNLLCDDLYKDRRQLFEKAIKGSYKWLKYKVSRFISSNYVEDAVQSSILNFYEYHIDRFNMNYGDSSELEKRAKNYFLKRFFWFLSDTNYYGKKFKNKILNDFEQGNDLFDKLGHKDNLFYGHCGWTSKMGDNEKKSGCMFNHNGNLGRRVFELSNVYIKETDIYLNQFKEYVKTVNIQQRLKSRIILFLCTFDKSILRTNYTYYMNKIKSLMADFNGV